MITRLTGHKYNTAAARKAENSKKYREKHQSRGYEEVVVYNDFIE